MAIIFEANATGASRRWTSLFDFLRRLTEPSATSAGDRQIARAIGQLSQFDDRELTDIGLCRSDLTPDGLAVAGARRRQRQLAIDAEASQRR